MTTPDASDQPDALLPCPFCGSVEISRRRRVVDYKGESVQLFCMNCEAAGPISTADTLEGAHQKAEAEWNNRHAKSETP